MYEIKVVLNRLEIKGQHKVYSIGRGRRQLTSNKQVSTCHLCTFVCKAPISNRIVVNMVKLVKEGCSLPNER